jgi:hypothetical protein
MMPSSDASVYRLSVADSHMPRLKEKKDWDKWYKAFYLMANTLGVWPYVTDEHDRKPFPDRPLLPIQESEPQAPDTSSNSATPETTATSSTAAGPASGTRRATLGRQHQQQQPPRIITDNNYHLELALYDRENTRYRELTAGKQKLTEWMLTTIDSRLQDLYLKRKDEVWDFVDALRESLRTHDADRRVEVRQEYQAVLLSFQKHAKRLPEWIQAWEDIVKKGKDYGITEVQNPET